MAGTGLGPTIDGVLSNAPEGVSSGSLDGNNWPNLTPVTVRKNIIGGIVPPNRSIIRGFLQNLCSNGIDVCLTFAELHTSMF